MHISVTVHALAEADREDQPHGAESLMKPIGSVTLGRDPQRSESIMNFGFDSLKKQQQQQTMSVTM